jgi:AcrR family transcriptional regulator
LIECYSNDVSEKVKLASSGAMSSGAASSEAVSVEPAKVETRFPRREEKARRTRRAVLDAARRLFVADGYGATSIKAIALEAGVAVQTVYVTFGNKPAILAEVLDVAIAGDDREVVVNAREWMAPVFAAPTPDARLRAYAAAVRRIHEGAGEVFVVVAEAAGTDPDVERLHSRAEARRRSGAASVIAAVEEVGRLRDGLTTDEAVDLLWLWNGPLVHRHLTVAAGWSGDAFEAWLADSLVRELLAPSTPPGRRRAD